MAESIAIDTVNDDNLVDEALDERHGGKFFTTYSPTNACRLGKP